MRSTVLYQSIIPAVRNMTAMPAALTASCIADARAVFRKDEMPERRQEDAEAEDLERLLAAQHQRPRRGAAQKRASRGTRSATSTTSAKNGTSRIGDRLFLLTGHSSFRNRPGNGSHTPWIVQLSLIRKAAAKITAAAG